MDDIVLFLQAIVDYIDTGFVWMTTMPFDQFVRVFWAIIFIEIPRYTVTTIVVFISHFLNPPREAIAAEGDDAPLVSVIVPALNEAETLPDLVRSVREQNYGNLETIIVDDGSTDDTRKVCESLVDHDVRYFRMTERQGKSAVLNLGMEASHGQYLVFMDSDSTLDRDCISKLLIRFRNENVGAVSGNLDVRNHNTNLLTWLQTVEYLVTLSVGRRFKALIGILAIVPGAIGAFRRDLMERVGRFEPGPGNDSDLTIRTRKLHKQIEFAEDGICRTNVPHHWRLWFRQRMRWDRNIIRNRMRRHSDIYDPTNANFWSSSFLSFIDTLLFVAILPLMWLLYAIDMMLNFTGDLIFIAFSIYLLHIVINAIRLLMALAISRFDHNPVHAFLILPLYGIYRIAVKIVRLLAIFQEIWFRSSYRDPFAPLKVRKQMDVY